MLLGLGLTAPLPAAHRPPAPTETPEADRQGFQLAGRVHLTEPEGTGQRRQGRGRGGEPPRRGRRAGQGGPPRPARAATASSRFTPTGSGTARTSTPTAGRSSAATLTSAS